MAFFGALSLDAIAVAFVANTCTITFGGGHCSPNWPSYWAGRIGEIGTLYLVVAALPMTILFFIIAIAEAETT